MKLKDNNDKGFYPSYYEVGIDDNNGNNYEKRDGYYLTNSYFGIVSVDSGYLFKRVKII